MTGSRGLGMLAGAAWRIAVWAALWIGLGPVEAGAQGRLPFDVRVPVRPMPAVSGDRAHLVYELRITNVGPRDLTMERVAVRGDDGATLAAWWGDSLRAIMIPTVATGPDVDARRLESGRQVVVFVLVSTATSRVPKKLDHLFVVSRADSAAITDSMAGFIVPVDRTQPPVLRSPFGDGGLWFAANGPGNTSGHRRTAIPLHGQARISQRFATDWLEFGPDGNLFHGDSSKNENWYGHGKPLVAVAAGTVVDVKDGIPENVPPGRAVPITLETVAGNYVILDIGDGFFAFYAHLMPGTVAVKVGDRVKPGQRIGLLGNTGNSTAPHLHLHISDAPSPLGSEGLPFVFDEYRWMGRIQDFTSDLPPAWLEANGGEIRRRELPMENDVVRFR